MFWVPTQALHNPSEARPEARPSRHARHSFREHIYQVQPMRDPMERKKIGEVFHYYGHIGVAAIRLTDGAVAVGDTIQIQGPTTNVEQTVDSLQIEHSVVPRADRGQEVGMKVRDRVRERDFVYKVVSETPPIPPPPPRVPPPPPPVVPSAPKPARPKARPKKPRQRRRKTRPREAKPRVRKTSRARRHKARRESRRPRSR
jgi:outer membrane biosynthesis protein TonB